MTKLSWTILIATLGRRATQLERLLAQLLPQATAFGDSVRVRALWNNGEQPLSVVRQALVVDANADYVSFVDDDDEVPPYFVDKVMEALTTCEPDYVGWQMQCYIDGVATKPTYHSLEYGSWSEDHAGYYRDVSHLNPVRHALALRCDFRRGDPPEDVSWADQLRPLLVGGAQCYIPNVMYHYRSSSHDSTWRPGSVDPARERHTRPAVDHPNFSWHSWSYVRD